MNTRITDFFGNCAGFFSSQISFCRSAGRVKVMMGNNLASSSVIYNHKITLSSLNVKSYVYKYNALVCIIGLCILCVFYAFATRCCVGGIQALLGTNLIHDFTAVTFSVKLTSFREKRWFPWNPWFFVNFSAFSLILTIPESYQQLLCGCCCLPRVAL